MKKYISPYVIMAVVAGLWILFFPYFAKDFIAHYFYMPFLGVIAATVANTTPAAAGIVYFPILTKLNMSPLTAVQFSLVIQAYGMGLGTFRWFLVNKRLFIFNVLPICLAGGLAGLVVSIVFYPIANPGMLSLIFNCIALLCTQFIFFSILCKCKYPKLDVRLNPLNISILLTFSFIGGLVSGWIGFGIDTMFYFILTVLFRINPAAAIVTSISLMAAMSIAGTALNLVFHSVPFSIWFAAIPGVTVAGLFLAAYLAMKLGAKNILILFSLLLSADFFVTFWTQQVIPISQTTRMIVTHGLIIYLVYIHARIFKESYKDIDTSLGEFSPEEERISP